MGSKPYTSIINYEPTSDTVLNNAVVRRDDEFRRQFHDQLLERTRRRFAERLIPDSLVE